MKNSRITDLIFVSVSMLLFAMNSASAVAHGVDGEFIQSSFNALVALLWGWLYFVYARQLFRRDRSDSQNIAHVHEFIRVVNKKVDSVEYLQSELAKQVGAPAVCLDADDKEITTDHMLLAGEQVLEVREVGFRSVHVWSATPNQDSEDLGWHTEMELKEKGARILVKE